MRDDLIVDTHFDTRQRLGRLLLALASTPSASAVGIDELTAAVLAGDDVRGVGRGAITILEAPRLAGNNARRASARSPFAAGPFTMHRIRSGQTVRLRQATAPPAPTRSATPAPGFFFGLVGSAAATPPPAEAPGPRQPVTLVAAPAPLPALTSPAGFVRDAGGTQARILILTGNGAARDAETWRGHLLLLGAGRTSVLTASEIHDQNLAQLLERSTGVFVLEDSAGSLIDACNANRRRLRDVIATYAPRLPIAAAGRGVRVLGDVAYFGLPSDRARQVKQGLELIPDAVAEDQFWETEGCERLVQCVLYADRGLGIGLGPENSVRIEHGQIVVIGAGQVVFIEGRRIADHAVPRAGSVEPASAIGLEVSVIPPDGVYDLASRQPRF
jgi:cyanophycinase-like exopeptidase